MTSLTNAPAYTLPGVPVVHPSHLEGDSSLATEILPGPPPLLSVQQAAAKRDPKKPSTLFSYLPATDPGSTYSGNMAGTSTLGAPEVDGPRRKRARVDKGSLAIGRAQRASARNVNTVPSPSETPIVDGTSVESPLQVIPDSDPLSMPVDLETPSLSRSNSAHNLAESSSSATNGKTRGARKGKGKQVDKSIVRVKEEEMAPPSLSPDPIVALNEDHCSACLYTGALVYCDGCPRAYHLWCLDPPMEASDIPEGDKWFCGACSLRKNPPPRLPPSLMSPLILQAQSNAGTPREFQIPDDIRNFFKDVGAGPRGAYMDLSEAKKPRLNHYGQVEERDPYRLKDRNNVPVLCFRCGTSALAETASAPPVSKRPRRSTSKATTSVESGKPIISCDYCNLHWHLDCLDSPLASMPPYTKKWMCPNHSDHTLMPKRRIPKQNAPPIEITGTNQFNNGNIEVIQPQATSSIHNKVAVDEVLINGRRYRVPERVIMLDFWSKISSERNPTQTRHDDVASAMSSPLTSLSSLEDLDDISSPPLEHSTTSQRSMSDSDVMAVAQLLCSLRTRPDDRTTLPNGSQITSDDSQAGPDTPTLNQNGVERPKRAIAAKRVENQVIPNSRQTGAPKANLPGPPTAPASTLTKRPSRMRVKAEPEEIIEIPGAQEKEPTTGKISEQKAGAARSRKPKEKKETGKPKSAALAASMPAPALPATTASINPSTPATPAIPLTPPSAPRAPVTTTTPTTPSLKIRLPRLSALNLHSNVTPQHTPTRSPSTSSLQASTDSRLRRSSRQRLSTSTSFPTSTDFSSLSLSSPTPLASKSNGVVASSTPPS